MSTLLNRTGGAQLGWASATWPLARLTVSSEQLSVSCALLGRFEFSQSQVVALEPFGVPLLGSGIRVVHSVREYPEKIAFVGVGSSKRLMDEISELGFNALGSRGEMPRRQGMPFRWGFLILLVGIWNALFLLDGAVPWGSPRPPGLYTLLALSLLMLTAVTLDRSSTFQSWVLKPGRFGSEVRPVARLVAVISLFLLGVFGVLRLAS